MKISASIVFLQDKQLTLMKKRNLLMTAVVLLAMGILPACNIIEECGTCELVTEYSNGTPTEYGTPLPFCGDALSEKQDASPVTISGVTTYWSCD
jgi:hypothetical protein